MPDPSAQSTLAAARFVSPDGPELPLLTTVSRALHQRGCDDLHRVPVLGRHGGLPSGPRRSVLAEKERAEAVPVELVDRFDADAVAAWMTGHYPPGRRPAVVLGSAHGAAAHLASALGAPWLPTTFTVTVPWPDGSVGDWTGAMEWGAKIADRLFVANPAVTVRQVHDPIRRGALCGAAVTLHVRLRRLPRAYRELIRSGLAPGGAALVLRDTRAWPVRDLTDRHSFQLGSPVDGLPHEDQTTDHPAFRQLLQNLGEDTWSTSSPDVTARYAELSGEPDLEHDLRELAVEIGRPVHRVLYPGPDVLSAWVADLYRDWVRSTGHPGDGCVVETGRLLDPWRVLASGLVPYWCESAARPTVDAAERWLAGSNPFAAVTVLPEPPGTACDAHAAVSQWRALASFGRPPAHLDHRALGRYPLLPLSTSHASTVLRSRHASIDPLGPLPLSQAVSALRLTGTRLGMLVT